MKVVLFLVFGSVACSSSGGAGIGQPCAEPAETSGNWSAMALPPANVGATLPAFAWTGQQFLVWGGIGYHTETGTCVPCAGGGIYDPKLNSWRPMTSVGAPTARVW